MTGSKTTSRTDASRVRDSGDFAWDGSDENERPLTLEEMQAGAAAYRKKRGRPPGGAKVSTTIRFDCDVLDAFRAAGPGWQSRMNAALRDWLEQHPS